MKKLANKNGFTIIELVVVIAIIGILAAVVLINVNGYLAKARNIKRLTEVENYIKAFQSAYADSGAYPYFGGAACCLGGNSCYTLEAGPGSVAICPAAVVNALKSYIPGMPADLYFLGLLNGYVYQPYFADDSTRCSTNTQPCLVFRISWYMEGVSSPNPCGIGTVLGTPPNGVECIYDSYLNR